MKKMLGLLLTAVTLVALVPRNASAGVEISARSRCGTLGVISRQCRRPVPPVPSGGKHRLPPVPIGKR